MKNNLFAYYGAIVTENEITSLMHQFGEKDLYLFLTSKGLKYRKLMSYFQTKQIIVGEELLWDFNNNVIEVNFEQQTLCCNKTISMLSSNPVQVKSKLLQVGVQTDPKYYILANYEV